MVLFLSKNYKNNLFNNIVRESSIVMKNNQKEACNILYLASQSVSRRFLLDQINIPYKVLPQNADEHKCDWSLSPDQVVKNIALYKMDHVILPATSDFQEGDFLYVLTADTVSQDSSGSINGKPKDYQDAVKQLKKSRGLNTIYSAFCLDKKRLINGSWITEDRVLEVISSCYTFDVPDQWIEKYLSSSIGLKTAGAIVIEEFGLQFLKEISGSYTAIIGLPLFELRQALERLNFFKT